MNESEYCNFSYKNEDFFLKGYSAEDYIFKTICSTKSFYEIDFLEYILLINKFRKSDNASVIDVGANIGNHTVFFRKFIANQVIAIEPNNLVLPYLYENIRNNECEVQVIDKAVGNKFGKGELIIVNETNMGMAKIDKSNLDNASGVDIITLDSLDNELTNSLSIIKIDVEGMEYEVILGAESLITKYKPEIFAEITDNIELEKIHSFLVQYGYYIVSIWGATPMYHFSTHQKMKYIYIFQKLKTYILSVLNRASKYAKYRLSNLI